MRVSHLLLVLSFPVLTRYASPPPPPAPAAVITPPAPLPTLGHDELLFHAFSLVGTPYRYGGSSPDNGCDCSGLTNYVFRESAGLTLPRTTAGLSALTGTTAADALTP